MLRRLAHLPEDEELLPRWKEDDLAVGAVGIGLHVLIEGTLGLLVLLVV